MHHFSQPRKGKSGISSHQFSRRDSMCRQALNVDDLIQGNLWVWDTKSMYDFQLIFTGITD
jgi:hypothetical protein